MTSESTTEASAADAATERAIAGAELYLACEMQRVEHLTRGGGELAVFSRGNPHRDRVNQDSAALFELGPRRLVLVVADGVGGARSGARASATAVRALCEALAEGRDGAPDGELARGALRGAILNGIERANRSVQKLSLGAGTTLAVVAIDNGVLRSFHVGDSSVLLVGQRGRVKLQTTSHSPVGYAVEAGLLADDDALHHPDLHLVSNIVGYERMSIEIGPRIELAARDTLVVGSDGLFDNLYLHEVIDQIRKGPLLHGGAALMGQVLARMRGDLGAAGDALPSKADDVTFMLYRRARG